MGDGALASGAVPRKLAPPSLGSARAAPLRRWLAYIWPAIALGRDRAALARAEDAPPLIEAAVTRLLTMGATHPGANGDPTLSGPVGPRDDPPVADDTLVPGGREITFFVIFSFAALLALLISTIWVEARSKYLYR